MIEELKQEIAVMRLSGIEDPMIWGWTKSHKLRYLKRAKRKYSKSNSYEWGIYPLNNFHGFSLVKMFPLLKTPIVTEEEILEMYADRYNTHYDRETVHNIEKMYEYYIEGKVVCLT